MTVAAGDAHPFPIYAGRFRVVAPLLDADGDLVTGATTPDSERSIDGATFADCTNEMTEIATASGVYFLDLTAAEMTSKSTAVILKSATAGMKTTVLTLYPVRMPIIRSGTAQAGAASTITLDSGASAKDAAYAGMWIQCSNNSPANVQGQTRRIVSYVGSTKVATVEAAWGTNPSSATTFDILCPETANLQAFMGKEFVDWNTAGVPRVDLDMIEGANVSTTTAQLGVNAVQAGATAWGSGAITAASIAADAITAAKIADGAIDAATFAAGAINAAAIATDAITAAKIADGAIDAATFAAGAIDNAAFNVTETLTANPATGGIVAGSFGAGAIDAAAIATDAIGSAEFSQGAADKVWSTAARALTDKAGFALSAAGIQAIWDALTSALTTVGSVGKLIVDNINATISSRASQTTLDTVDDFLDTEVAAILAAVDTEVAAIKTVTDALPNGGALTLIQSDLDNIQTRIPAALTAGGNMKADGLAIDGSTAAATALNRGTRGNVLGTVGAASTTTSIVTSALDPAAAVADQFKGRIVTFMRDTTTTNLQGQSTDITASTALGVLTCTALTTAPVSGDVFVIT